MNNRFLILAGYIFAVWLAAFSPTIAQLGGDGSPSLGAWNRPTRASLGAAKSGVNSDIIELTGLTTPLSIEQGGTNSITAAAARTALGVAKLGANSDITSLTGLTTPLSTGQGGTGATTATDARTNLSAAKLGANSDITSITGLTTPLNPTMGGSGFNRPINFLVNPFARRFYQWSIRQSGTAYDQFGGYSTTATGTLSALADATGVYTNCATAASADSTGGVTGYYGGVSNVFAREKGVVYYTCFKTGPDAQDLEDCRIRVGLSNSANLWTTNSPTGSSLLLDYCPAVHGTAFFRVYHGPVGSLSTTVTTIPVATNTRYDVIVDTNTNSSTVSMYVSTDNGVTWTTVLNNEATAIPAASVGMGACAGISTTEAEAKEFRVGQASIVTR
jgi:hypothetical protein